MIKNIIIFSIFLLPLNALACTSDMQCSPGNKCVKSAGSYSMDGVCVTPTDKYGNRTYYSGPSSYGPHRISGCKFNTDCNIGYSCFKRVGEIEGICVK
jgi:hypothetical protein